MQFIDLKTQYQVLKQEVDARIAEVLASGQFIMGPQVEELEQELAVRTGSRYCISCSSGTDALLIALMALDIGQGDEVITSPFSFVATAEVIALLGAAPVFVDVDRRTYSLDAGLLETVISSRTKAILCVSLYGQCAEMDVINSVAGAHGIPVIEDAAQSFGAKYRERASCNISTIGCTSFFPSKPLGCYGDGGACFTNDEELAGKMRQIRVHGQDSRYHHPRLGINGRLDTLQAAILLAKLKSFDAELAARARVARRYDVLLEDFVITPFIESHNASVYAQYTIQVEERHQFQQQLLALGIPTSVHYPVPIHMQPAFTAYAPRSGSLPVAEAAAKHVLSLPMHPYLTEEQQLAVANAVRRAAERRTMVALSAS